MYDWDIVKWLNMYLPALLRAPKRMGILAAILGPLKQTISNSEGTLWLQFADFREFVNLRTRYSIQQASLQALLNKLFDPDLKRIYLVTETDILSINYGRVDGDTDSIPNVYGTLGNTEPAAYGVVAADAEAEFNGYVHVPIGLQTREAEIKAWVDYYIYLSRTYKIIYF